MRRREFIAGLGVAAWPMLLRAQQAERMHRMGVLMGLVESDPEAQARITTLRQSLRELGWTEGRNLLIDYRWGASDPDRYRTAAAQLIALAPDVVVTENGNIVRLLQQVHPAVTIVFVGANDPVGGGLVESLARPGGNTTGFSGIEFGMSGKFLGLLVEIAPRVTQAAVVRDPSSTVGTGYLGAIQGTAAALKVELRPVDSRDAGAIERGITAFAREPNGGVLVPPSTLATIHRDLIIKLAARYKLPAVYPHRFFVMGGGLISFGPDRTDQFRLAAKYIDRILKGEKPGDLPVQAPVKYETAINLKTAKALGLTIPETLLATADEVIQ